MGQEETAVNGLFVPEVFANRIARSRWNPPALSGLLRLLRFKYAPRLPPRRYENPARALLKLKGRGLGNPSRKG
jgi:hypothetical protein